MADNYPMDQTQDYHRAPFSAGYQNGKYEVHIFRYPQMNSRLFVIYENGKRKLGEGGHTTLSAAIARCDNLACGEK